MVAMATWWSAARPIRRIRIVPCSSIHRATIITTSMVFPIISCSTWMAPSRRKRSLEDLLKYTNDNKSSGYTCAFQGITTGWADWYFKQLSGQWIDITGVPEGDYIVHVEINAAHTFPEGANRYTNVIEAAIHVPDPRNKVTIDNSPAAVD